MTFRQFAFNQVMRNKRLYMAYFLSSLFTVMVFFTFAIFAFHPAFRDGAVHRYVLFGMSVAGGIIYVFSFFFVLYSMSSFFAFPKERIRSANGSRRFQQPNSPSGVFGKHIDRFSCNRWRDCHRLDLCQSDSFDCRECADYRGVARLLFSDARHHRHFCEFHDSLFLHIFVRLICAAVK